MSYTHISSRIPRSIRKKEAVYSSETHVPITQTTRRHVPEDSNLKILLLQHHDCETVCSPNDLEADGHMKVRMIVLTL